MKLIIIFAVSFLTGILASLGLGGGMVLILYLTLFGGTNQLEAQGVNLIFFLPIAALSLIFHTRNKLVEWKKVLPSLITGCIFALAFSLIAINIHTDVLSRLFGGFITLTGVYMLIKKYKNRKK